MSTQQLTIQTVPEIAPIQRRGILMVLTALSISLVINVAVHYAPVQASVEPTFNEQVLINMTNKERKAQGLGELTYSPKLAAAARAKAYDMLAKGYFDHVTPEGKQPWTFVQSTGYNYLKAGENLAIDYPTVTGPIDGWMASPTHRANILKADYEEIGMAEVTGKFQGRETRIVVQMFGTPQFSVKPIVELFAK